MPSTWSQPGHFHKDADGGISVPAEQDKPCSRVTERKSQETRCYAQCLCSFL